MTDLFLFQQFKQAGVGNANIYNNCFENLKTEKNNKKKTISTKSDPEADCLQLT